MSDLSERLRPILDKISQWRADAGVIKALAEQAIARKQVSEEQLFRVEEISTAVYREIDALTEIKEQAAEAPALDLALISEVDDALRLVLLEITELGTLMYSARSLDTVPEIVEGEIAPAASEIKIGALI